MLFYIIYEVSYDGYKFEWLIILSITAIALAIFTIVTKSPIYSILYLIGLFIAISLYLIVCKLHFIGISYLLVYVGAISILFLFILMLIDVRISELLTEGRNSTVLSVLVAVTFSIIFNAKLPYISDIYNQLYNIINYISIHEVVKLFDNITTIVYFDITNDFVSTVYSCSWDSSLIEISHISSIGNILYNLLFITLIIVGVILLLAIVGCIITTVKPKDTIDYINKNISYDYVDKIELKSGVDPDFWKDLFTILLNIFSENVDDKTLNRIAELINSGGLNMLLMSISILLSLSQDPVMIEHASNIMEQLPNIIDQAQNINGVDSATVDTINSNALNSLTDEYDPTYELVYRPIDLSDKSIDLDYIRGILVPVVYDILEPIANNIIGNNNTPYNFDPAEATQYFSPSDADNTSDGRVYSTNTNFLTRTDSSYARVREFVQSHREIPITPSVLEFVPQIQQYLNTTNLPTRSIRHRLPSEYNNTTNYEEISNNINAEDLTNEEIQSQIDSLTSDILNHIDLTREQISIYVNYVSSFDRFLSQLNTIMDIDHPARINIVQLGELFSQNFNQFNLEVDDGSIQIQNVSETINQQLNYAESVHAYISYLENILRTRDSNYVGHAHVYREMIDILHRDVDIFNNDRAFLRIALLHTIERWHAIDSHLINPHD